jgi:cytochrome c biogenesis factor
MVFGVFSYDYLLQYNSVVFVGIVLVVLLATLFKASLV